MDWGTVGVIAGLLALQSGAFGLVLHWLHQDLLGLRSDVGTVRSDLGDLRADVHALETRMLADHGQRIARLEAHGRR
jgi:hypothetical protein